MNPKLILAVLVLAAFVSGGCSRKADVLGRWKADVVDKDAKGTVGGEFVQRLLGMTLEFRRDGTCDMTMLVKLPGTYEVSGNRVTVRFDKTADNSGSDAHNNQPMVLDLSGDGKTLTAENGDSNSHGDLTFKKETESN
jgi:hypothetical protein